MNANRNHRRCDAGRMKKLLADGELSLRDLAERMDRDIGYIANLALSLPEEFEWTGFRDRIGTWMIHTKRIDPQNFVVEAGR